MIDQFMMINQGEMLGEKIGDGIGKSLPVDLGELLPDYGRIGKVIIFPADFNFYSASDNFPVNIDNAILGHLRLLGSFLPNNIRASTRLAPVPMAIGGGLEEYILKKLVVTSSFFSIFRLFYHTIIKYIF